METLQKSVNLSFYTFVESLVKHELAIFEFVLVGDVNVLSVFFELNIFVCVKEFGRKDEILTKHFCIVLQHIEKTFV